MELTVFEKLLTPLGESALAAARELQPNDKTFLTTFEKLRKRFSPDLAKAAVETTILRAKAASKFPHAEKLFFTREALEQASSWPVATHRMRRFRDFSTVGDFCCGIGADAMALASAGVSVIAIERDPLKARMAEVNLTSSRLNEKNRVVVANVVTDPLPRVEAFFCDPGRRQDGRRFLSLADYQPPPDAVLSRFPRDYPAAFKLAPGVPWDDLLTFDGEAEFISLNGELKECVLWLGPLKTTRRRATALPSGLTLTADEPDVPPPTCAPLRYVYDPDPSLTRSGLLTNFANTIDGYLLDERFGFLTTNLGTLTPFATIYEVEETLPFHAKQLGEWFRTHNIGRITVVKRGSPVDSDELMRRWKLRGDEHREVLLTQVEGKPVAIIARRVE